MATSFKENWRRDLTKGLVLDRPANEVPDGAWLSAHNVRFRNNAVCLAGGSVKVATVPTGTSKLINHIAHARDTNNAEQVLICTPNYVFQIFKKAGPVALNAVAFALDPLKRWSSCQLIHNTILVQPETPTQVWAGPGESLAALTGAPKGIQCAEFAGHVLIVQPDGAVQELKGSGLNDPEDWAYLDPASDADRMQVSAGGDAIQCVVSLGDYAAMFKEDSTHLLSYIQAAEATYGRQLISTIGGAVSPFSVADIGGGRNVFLGKTNVHLLTLNAQQRIGDVIWPYLMANADFSTIAQASWAARNTTYDEVVFAIPSVNGGMVALVYNYLTGGFTTRDWPYTAAATVRAPNADAISEHTEKIEEWLDQIGYGITPNADSFMAGDADGNLFALDVAESDATGVLETGDDEYGDPRAVKQENGMLVDCDQTGAALQVYVSARMNRRDPVVWQGPYPVGMNGRVDYNAKGRVFRRKFTKAGGTLALYGYAPLARMVSPK